MCFSAKASFIAAGALSAVGLLSIREAKNRNIIPFASTPLIFAVQQASEGLVWLALSKTIPHYFTDYGMYSFVFFAGTWWPLWAPITIYCIENNAIQKKFLCVTIIVGAITAFLYFISLLTQPLQAFVVNHHLYYPTLSYPFSSRNSIAQFCESIIPEMYLIATIIPVFISSVRYVWIIGIIMGLACLISNIFFIPATASIWCFLAAIISALIYFVVRMSKKE
jgi:hypothetical protein